LGSAHRMSAPYQAFRCADGYITIGGANDRTFHRICEVLGHPEGRGRPGVRTDVMRIRNRADLAARVEAITTAKPRTHWLELFDAHNIPCGPINDYSQVFEDPQVIARELVVDVEHPTLGAIRALGSPIKLSATPPDVRRRAPLLGEHTEEVLSEAGIRNPGSGIRPSGSRSPDSDFARAISEREGFDLRRPSTRNVDVLPTVSFAE